MGAPEGLSPGEMATSLIVLFTPSRSGTWSFHNDTVFIETVKVTDKQIQ